MINMTQNSAKVRPSAGKLLEEIEKFILDIKENSENFSQIDRKKYQFLNFVNK